MIRQGEMKPRPTWTRRDLLTPSLGDPPRLRVVSGIGVEEAPPDANMNVGRGRPVAPVSHIAHRVVTRDACGCRDSGRPVGRRR
jgi:hypothetical protein